MESAATSIFDTRSFAPANRFRAWQSSIGVIFDPSLDDSADPLVFRARVEAAMVGQVFLGHLVSDTQRFQRSKSKILSDGLDCYMLQVFLRGCCEVQDGRHTRLVRPGDIYVVDASAPLDAIDYDFSHLTALIPRDLLSCNLVRPDAHHRRVIPRDLPLAKLLYGYLCNLNANHTGMSAHDSEAASAALLSLTQSILNRRPSGTSSHLDDTAVDMAVISRINDFIETNLSDEALGPELVMTALGVSRTQLYRLFQPFGGVASEIQRRRLRRSLQDLLNQSHRRMRIGEIAYRWGFRSQSHYIRAFKRRYGMTPGDAREARVLMLTSAQTHTHDYERWIAGLAR